MYYIACFLIATLSLASTSFLHANIIHISCDTTTIQEAINGSIEGDTIMVEPGVCYEHDVDFLGKAITVMSTDPEDSAMVAATVVDGGFLGRVFIFQSGEDLTSVLAGFTITNGDGGIHGSNYSSPTITKNIISGNYAIGDGGGIRCDYYSSPIISNNKITGNVADIGAGGGISLSAWSSPIIENNVISENTANKGGGIDCNDYSDAMISNNIISGNSAYYGGGIYCFFSSPNLINNTISEDSAGVFGGGIVCTESSAMVVVNTILWDNVAPMGKEIYVGDNYYPSTLTISYSDVEGGQSVVHVDSLCAFNWGAGMIDTLPHFIDPENNDFHLQESSPCVDAGDPAIEDRCRPPGLGEERSDMGAYGGEDNCDWSEVLFDLLILPMGPVTVSIGDTLHFANYIQNNTPYAAWGDYWVSVLLPDLTDVVVPEALLNFPNPMSGPIFSGNSIDFDNWLWIPPVADPGSYRLIGRIGHYPDLVVDESSFEFQVVE